MTNWDKNYRCSHPSTTAGEMSGHVFPWNRLFSGMLSGRDSICVEGCFLYYLYLLFPVQDVWFIKTFVVTKVTYSGSEETRRTLQSWSFGCFLCVACIRMPDQTNQSLATIYIWCSLVNVGLDVVHIFLTAYTFHNRWVVLSTYYQCLHVFPLSWTY